MSDQHAELAAACESVGILTYRGRCLHNMGRMVRPPLPRATINPHKHRANVQARPA